MLIESSWIWWVSKYVVFRVYNFMENWYFYCFVWNMCCVCMFLIFLGGIAIRTSFSLSGLAFWDYFLGLWVKFFRHCARFLHWKESEKSCELFSDFWRVPECICKSGITRLFTQVSHKFPKPKSSPVSLPNFMHT